MRLHDKLQIFISEFVPLKMSVPRIFLPIVSLKFGACYITYQCQLQQKMLLYVYIYFLSFFFYQKISVIILISCFDGV